jgi:flagellar motility protein MotE (MotC chaperone)
MMTKLQNPFLAAALGLLLSCGLGAYLCWKAALPVMAAALASHAKHEEEKKVQSWDFWTIEIENLSNELKEERAALQKRSNALDQRAAQLESEGKALGQIRTDIERLRKEIGDRLIAVNADEAKNLRTLAQTYTNLTPKAAVAILREMDDLSAVKILSLMKPDVVAHLFEEMSRTSGPDGTLARRAALLSDKLRLIKSGAGKPESAG